MGLWRYIARRMVLAALVLVIVSIATFLLAHAVPGDPITAIMSDRQADNREVRAALERRWGLDQPLHLQYVYYVRNLLRGDLGESISRRRPVADELRQRIPATIELTGLRDGVRHPARGAARHRLGAQARPLARSPRPLRHADRDLDPRLLARSAAALLCSSTACSGCPGRAGSTSG